MRKVEYREKKVVEKIAKAKKKVDYKAKNIEGMDDKFKIDEIKEEKLNVNYKPNKECDIQIDYKDSNSNINKINSIEEIKNKYLYYNVNFTSNKLSTDNINKIKSMNLNINNEVLLKLSTEYTISDYLDKTMNFCIVLDDNIFLEDEYNLQNHQITPNYKSAKNYIISCLYDTIKDIELNIFTVKNLEKINLDNIRISIVSSLLKDTSFKPYLKLSELLDNVYTLFNSSYDNVLNSINNKNNKVINNENVINNLINMSKLNWKTDEDSLKVVYFYNISDVHNDIMKSKKEEIENAVDDINDLFLDGMSYLKMKDGLSSNLVKNLKEKITIDELRTSYLNNK